MIALGISISQGKGPCLPAAIPEYEVADGLLVLGGVAASDAPTSGNLGIPSWELES